MILKLKRLQKICILFNVTFKPFLFFTLMEMFNLLVFENVCNTVRRLES